ncbi:MAG: 2-oxoacid:acceptor oxidoreductase subunit alpha [Verrucomicrobia bacterium]|jgi:2-oxoglutarate ferredoxin oxidoreductase subunit alpha|nr:2-oxoacid:acceptor oxidoreductase subunit alpha [Verrucomicrobiota bacterium]MDA0905331.1 2-oxoacid:acceptor oxidoreductase subunit alpha [Verrucomicrobiota bacterium]
MTQATDSFEEIESAVVRFAGDSGDGMQTIGERFTDSSAFAGNDIATLPDFPAEIRAPAGTLAGVSGYQLQFGSRSILTPGDEPDALVAMNPAALKANIADLPEGGLLVVNVDSFKSMNLKKAGYESNPLEDEDFRKKYQLIELDLTTLTKEALTDSPLKPSDKARCKNFFALGFMCYVYGRPLEPTLNFFNQKWGKKLPEVADANSTALKAGHNLGDTMETARNRYQLAKAAVQPGVYRKISGNEATVYGLVAGAQCANRELLYSGYPITPASPVLEGLSALKKFGVKTVQAEDEIAAMGVAIGASFAGDLSVVATSGPGMCLKSEFIGLASITELPVIICNVQRGGPSTGLPTKTEQSDLLQSLFSRHGDCPLPVIAAHSPSDCFDCAVEACRIALTYCTPVIFLSDLYVANGAEPWLVPNASDLPKIHVKFADPSEPYISFKRNPETLARTQAIPGQPGLEHRIGGLEKSEDGGVSYDPENHEKMTHLRADKVERIADSLPPLELHGEDQGDLLAIGWGGTYGAITSAVQAMQAEGFSVSSVHLRHLNPLPKDLGDIIGRFKKVIVPELNLGQLSLILRAKYLVDAIPLTKVQGKPFKVSELRTAFHKELS